MHTPSRTALLYSLMALASGMPVSRSTPAAARESWTITSMSRNCTASLSECTWAFGIEMPLDGEAGTVTDWGEHTVLAPGAGTPATRVPAGGSPASSCGKDGRFTVTSGWSGVFGEGEGFTVLSVADYAARTIAFPSYRDRDVEGGAVVVPDKNCTVEVIPA
ncbi:hypothetical protein DL768_000832 [Monosporascus sp. mg162]|nr:hypothetical protein DL768_000832 [Monosporascus sp. mg162]